MKPFSHDSKGYSLDEKKYAVALSRESSEASIQVTIEMKKIYYCRKRFNGIRASLTESEVQEFEETCKRDKWSYSDFNSNQEIFN